MNVPVLEKLRVFKEDQGLSKTSLSPGLYQSTLKVFI